MPVVIELEIPKPKEKEARSAAKAAGGKLLLDPDEGLWTFMGSSLPTELKPFDRNGNGKKQEFVLDVPFEERNVASAHGARWDKDNKAYTWEGTHLPLELKGYKSDPFTWEYFVEKELNDNLPPLPEQEPDMFPREHQEEASSIIQKVAKAGRVGFLLADDVGVGKTITTWDAARKIKTAKKILIVCPRDVIPHWRKVIFRMGGYQGKEIITINFARLDRLFTVPKKTQSGKKRKKKVKSKKALARAGKPMKFDLVIIDESHRCKNPTAARSKMCAKLVAEAKFTMWLSATAGQNPLELSYLAPLMADVTGDRVSELKEWEKWCQKQGIQISRGAFGKWEWESNEADCDTMNQLLFGGKLPAGIRRRPQDIAGWPEINRILTPVELTPGQKKLYNRAWNEFKNEWKEAKSKTRKKSKTNGGSEGKTNGLVAQLRFRQKASLLRTQGTIDLALDLLENNRQVAISVAFHDTLEIIKEALEKARYDVAVIHGNLTAKQKESERMAFQTGEKSVVLFTVEESISLHQGEHNDVPRSEIIHDLRWSAIQMAQVEGRCHRDGKYAEMYWMYGEDTIEARIAKVVAGRIKSMKSMIGDDTETVKEIEAILESAE